jgi:hypothetical protein
VAQAKGGRITISSFSSHQVRLINCVLSQNILLDDAIAVVVNPNVPESVYQCEFQPVPIVNSENSENSENKPVAPYEGTLIPRIPRDSCTQIPRYPKIWQYW